MKNETKGADGAGTKTAGERRWTVPRTVLVETVAQHFHYEEHQHEGYAWAWPEYADDDGRRGNSGYVSITPPVVQMECREAAERLVRLFERFAPTPAPAATPGVPDSLRALSEAVASAAAEQKKSGDLYNAAARRSERTFEDLTEVYEAFECADKKLRQAKDALADHCLSLIAAQPAGQAGDAGTGADAGLKDAIADIVSRAEKDQAFLRRTLARMREEPAPDSTRTGAAETIPVPVELVKMAHKLTWSVSGDAYLGNEPETELAEEVDAGLFAAQRAALAARPEAPSDAGWSETFETIAQWCEETFGPITAERIVSRAGEEMDELRAEPTRVEEAADVLICLARYPGLWAAVERKMKVNRGRKWRLMGDGTGYHIKPTPPSDRASSGQGGR